MRDKSVPSWEEMEKSPLQCVARTRSSAVSQQSPDKPGEK